MSTYFILGGSRGIGLALVTKFAKTKTNSVIVSVRNEKAGEEINQLGFDNVKVIYLDITAPYDEFVKEFKKFDQLAPNGIDVFVNNAAVLGPGLFYKLQDYDVDCYDKVLATNVSGVAKACKAIYRYLYKGTGTKKTIIISSLAGQSKIMFTTHAYGVSKAAVNHLGLELAFENKSSEEDIIKNSVTVLLHPGTVITDMSKSAIDTLGREIFITTEQSASGIAKVIEGLKAEDSGKFFDYEGKEVDF